MPKQKLELKTLADFEKAGWSVMGDIDETIISPRGNCYSSHNFIGNACPVCLQYEEDNPSYSDEEEGFAPCTGHDPELQADIENAIIYHSLLQKRTLGQLARICINKS